MHLEITYRRSGADGQPRHAILGVCLMAPEKNNMSVDIVYIIQEVCLGLKRLGNI